MDGCPVAIASSGLSIASGRALFGLRVRRALIVFRTMRENYSPRGVSWIVARDIAGKVRCPPGGVKDFRIRLFPL